MNDQELRRALRDLPRHGASDGFTRRTLARIEGCAAPDAADGPPRPATWGPGRVAAAAALLVAAIGLLTLLPGPAGKSAGDGRTGGRPAASPTSPASPISPISPTSAASTGRRADLRELRAERDRLAAELDELKRQLHAAPAAGSNLRVEPTAGDPVLYLGGDDRIDLVLDLGRLAAERGEGVVPTASRGGSS